MMHKVPLKYIPGREWRESTIVSVHGTIAVLPDIDEWPQAKPHGADGGAIIIERDETGRKLVVAYNNLDDLLDLADEVVRVAQIPSAAAQAEALDRLLPTVKAVITNCKSGA